MSKKAFKFIGIVLVMTFVLSAFAGFGVSAAESITNLYDNSKAQMGIPNTSSRDGALSNNPHYFASNLIEVKAGDVITMGPCNVGQGHYLSAYNASGTAVAKVSYANCTQVDVIQGDAVIVKWTVPSNVTSIRMATAQMYYDCTVITVNQEFKKDDYFAEMDKQKINIDFLRPIKATGTLVNLFPKSDKTYAGRVDATNKEVASANYRSSDYIAVKPGDVLYFGAAVSTQGYHLALQDENKKGTVTINSTYMVEYDDIGRGYAIYSYRIRPGTAYVRVVAATGVYDDGIQLVTLNQPFLGEDYRKMFNITLTDNSSNKSPLNGLKGLFMGDSISYGAGDTLSYLHTGRAWAGRIEDATGLKTTNASVSGAKASFLAGDDSAKWLFNQYKEYSDEKFDLIVMHGGVNDARHNRPIGTISESTSEGDLVKNIGTYVGGLQWLFHNIKETFPEAKLFFIANHRLDGHATGQAKNMGPYFDMAKQLCEKYEVVFIDLYNNKELNDKLQTTTTKYLPDTLHLNAEGYGIITPYIISALEAEMKTEETTTPEETTTAVPDVTTVPEGETTTETPDGSKQGGCGSYAGTGFAVVAIISLAGSMLARKKK